VLNKKLNFFQKAKPKNLMNLQEFVSESLKQILSGVAEARIEYPESVSPNISRADDAPKMLTAYGHIYSPVTMIDFDVAVTVQSKTEAGVKGGLFIVSAGIGSNASTASEHQTVSRLKFSIPLAYLDKKRSQ
jgi:hypothetical protein